MEIYSKGFLQLQKCKFLKPIKNKVDVIIVKESLSVAHPLNPVSLRPKCTSNTVRTIWIHHILNNICHENLLIKEGKSNLLIYAEIINSNIKSLNRLFESK